MNGKRRHGSILIILCLALTICFGSVVAMADEDAHIGAQVSVSIQSFNQELARGEVYAYTFKEAIQRLSANSSSVTITFNQSGTQSSIHSVNGIDNNHFSSGGWYGYIVRGTQTLRPDNYLDVLLENDDEIVLYYGHAIDTKIVSKFSAVLHNSFVTFQAASTYTEWLESNGVWVKDERNENISDLKIHLFLPGGGQKVLKTNAVGSVSARLSKLGMYRFYGEDYRTGSIPGVVRTNDHYFFYGVADPEHVSRAEAAAFVVGLFDIDKNPSGSDRFLDVNEKTPYQAEIRTALSAGIVKGFTDETFKPNDDVSVMQLAIMLTQAETGIENPTAYYTTGLPAWAQSKIDTGIQQRLIVPLGKDWLETITQQDLETICDLLSK